MVTESSLKARQVKNLVSATELTASVNSDNSLAPGVFGGYGLRQQRFMIRGEDADIRTDGFLVSDNFFGDDSVDISVFERIEVVKGAAGFYGQGSLGGYINKTRKKPAADFSADISLQVGSYDTYRTEGGVTGSLNDAKTIRGRLDFVYEDAGAFTDDINSNRIMFAPTLETIIDDRTRMLFQVLYQKDRFDFNPLIPFELVDDQIKPYANFSSRTELYGATGEKSINETYHAALTINHEISDRWLSSLYLQGVKQQRHLIEGSYASVYAGSLYNSNERYESDMNNWTGELRLQGTFDAFNKEHQAVFGLEANKQELEGRNGFGYRYIGPVNSFTGNMGNYPCVPSSELPFNFYAEASSENKAIYGQFQLSLLERTKLLVGARYDIAKNQNTRNGNGDKQTNKDWTSRIGLTQVLSDNISAYVVYAESFTPINLTTVDNQLLDPQKGKGFELGFKSDWFENQLGVNVSVYQQELDNMPLADTENSQRSGITYYVSSGIHRTDGVEFELNGSLLPEWRFSAAASWMDNKFTEKNDPFHNFSADGTPLCQSSCHP